MSMSRSNIGFNLIQFIRINKKTGYVFNIFTSEFFITRDIPIIESILLNMNLQIFIFNQNEIYMKHDYYIISYLSLTQQEHKIR